jgi:hypothetical protein
MPTGEDAAAIENCYSPLTAHRRADEPGARTAEVAWRSHNTHGILFVRPFRAAAAMPVDQDHAVMLCAHSDRRDLRSAACPLPMRLPPFIRSARAEPLCTRRPSYRAYRAGARSGMAVLTVILPSEGDVIVEIFEARIIANPKRIAPAPVCEYNWTKAQAAGTSFGLKAQGEDC